MKIQLITSRTTPNRSLLAFGIMILLMQSTSAQYAPETLNYAYMQQTVVSGSLPFASEGTVNMGLTLGNWLSFGTTGDVAPSGLGTYFYARTGPNTAIFSPSRTNLSPPFAPSGTVTFISPTTGTFTLSGTYGGFTGSARGTFVLTILEPKAQTGADTGVVIFEVYELASEPSSFRRLSNISTRAFVGSGGHVLIGGFTITGSTAETVLIRAVGPSLSTLGVSGVLNSPKLTLYDGASRVIAVNAGWENAPTRGSSPVNAVIQRASAADMARVGAFALPVASPDSAVLATLPPGGYTVIVSGQ